MNKDSQFHTNNWGYKIIDKLCMDPLERHLNSSQDFICFSEEVMPKVRLEQKKQE